MPRDGLLVSAAEEWVQRFNSYTEISPGGNGVKVVAEAKKPSGAGCKSKEIVGYRETEVYDAARFFAITGKRYPGTPPTVEIRQEQVDELCCVLFPPKRPLRLVGAISEGFDGDDADLIDKACTAKNGQKFSRLWNGDTSMHGADDSAADQALCCLLAFWTGRDAARMDQLFRQSGLFREKWDERRGSQTYGQLTIQKAIKECSVVYTPRKQSQTSKPSTAAESDDADIKLGQRDPLTGRLILSPQRTLPTAKAFVEQFHTHANGRTLHTYAGVMFRWQDNCYREIEDNAIRHIVQPWLHDALRPVKTRNGEVRLDDFNDNPATVTGAVETIRCFTHVSSSLETPCWLSADPETPADEILSRKTLNLHIPSGQILPATPALFTFNALGFDYLDEPEAPERWIKFLEQLFGDDLESVQLLQEWLGYTLTPDTSQQKMLLVVGPRRSGKGTIGRVVRRLVGHANVVGPTISSLTRNFGLQPLIGKSLAIVSDARFTGENIQIVVERLLCISGEDTITIDRKYLPAVSLKLPTRFMFFTNELPTFTDASNALAGRFLILRLTRSFYGSEDMQLTQKLCEELPGILKWSLEGWKRLRARGHFVQPESAKAAIQDLEDLASPVAAFARERCAVAAGHRASVDGLYKAWQD